MSPPPALVGGQYGGPPRRRASPALVALALVLALGGCAQQRSGARPGCATSAAGDTLGGGGCLDDQYRQLYHPGRGTDYGA